MVIQILSIILGEFKINTAIQNVSWANCDITQVNSIAPFYSERVKHSWKVL